MRFFNIDDDQTIFTGGHVGIGSGQIDSPCIRQCHICGADQCRFVRTGDVNGLHALGGRDEEVAKLQRGSAHVTQRQCGGDGWL